MAPTAAFLLLLALTSDPFWFHQNDIIWAPNAPLLTFLWPILVIAACPHFSYAGNTHNNTHNNHIIASLRRTSRNHVRFKPPPFHQNGIIWAPNAPLLTLRRPILVIAASSHISYAGCTHNTIFASLRQTSRNHVRFKPPLTPRPANDLKVELSSLGLFDMGRKPELDNLLVEHYAFPSLSSSMTRPYISVSNNGRSIPVENVYVPELLFRNLLTGLNFNDDQCT